MSQAAKPVVVGLEPFEIIFGENQEGVFPLHTLRKPDGCVISRWELTEREIQTLKDGGSIFVYQHTFFQAPMPLSIEVLQASIDSEATREVLGLDTELNHRIRSGAISELPMLIVDRKAKIKEQPKKFANAEVYFDWAECLMLEHGKRPPEQAEMDFAEWQVAEIVRLRTLLLETVKSV